MTKSGTRLTTATFERPADLADGSDPRVLYARSYLLTRLVVGAIGICLPFLLWVVDALVLRGGPTTRDSLSDYYHSGARDLFVGALCVIGCLLLTYLAAQPRTWDYWLSTVAGVAVLGVASLPTGDDTVGVVHFVCAGVFILSLAALCFVFAARDRRYGGHPRLHRACGIAILAAVAWVLLGTVVDLSIGWLTSVYLGEVVSVWAFGLSWLVKGADLLHLTPASARRTPGR